MCSSGLPLLLWLPTRWKNWACLLKKDHLLFFAAQKRAGTYQIGNMKTHGSNGFDCSPWDFCGFQIAVSSRLSTGQDSRCEGSHIGCTSRMEHLQKLQTPGPLLSWHRGTKKIHSESFPKIWFNMIQLDSAIKNCKNCNWSKWIWFQHLDFFVRQVTGPHQSFATAPRSSCKPPTLQFQQLPQNNFQPSWCWATLGGRLSPELTGEHDCTWPDKTT